MVFVDTSALVKLYVTEAGSEALVARLDNQDVAISTLAWAEAHAAFGRLRRERRLTEPAWSALVSGFGADWGSFLRVPLDGALDASIADLCRRHPLRGADSVQLASALFLAREGLDVTFACCDQRLLDAAAAERLATFDPCAPH